MFLHGEPGGSISEKVAVFDWRIIIVLFCLIREDVEKHSFWELKENDVFILWRIWKKSERISEPFQMVCFWRKFQLYFGVNMPLLVSQKE